MPTTFAQRSRGAAPVGPRRSSRRVVLLAVAVWLALVVGCLLVGARLRADGLLPIDDVPPLHADWRRRILTWEVLPAVGYAVAAIALLPRFASTVRWWLLPVGAASGTALWACLLAASDGVGWLAEPLTHSSEYLSVAESVGDPLAFLRGFADHVGGYPTHVAGHPPLPVLVFWLPHVLGLPTAPAAAAVCILLGSSATAAVLVTARQLLGEERARAAVPYLVLAPYALTVATSADAMFLGVTAWGSTLLALACARSSVLLGGFAGVLLGATPYLNYGLLPLGAVAVAVVLLRPSRAAVIGLLVGACLVVLAFTGAGFWWFGGVLATHERWASGRGSDRPYWYVLFGNLALFAMLTGPATAAGLARLRGLRPWLLVGSTLVALAVVDLSGVTRLEVERIWLPFAPWVMLATSALCPSVSRRWLVGQVIVAVLVQATVALVW